MTITKVPVSRVDADANVIRVHRPSDGVHITDLPVHDTAGVAEVSAKLRSAQADWEDLGVEGRIEWVRRMRQWILDNTDRLDAIMQNEGGRVVNEPYGEILLLMEVFDYYLRVARDVLAPRSVRAHSLLATGKKFTLHHHPYPLTGVIGAWNYPVLTSIGDAIPALLAGSSVLLKPSEVCPLVVRELVRGWRTELGAPPVLDAVFGAGDIGTALVDSADFIQFTGSVPTGRRVAERASRNLTRFSLELGGKDPLLVLDGANLNRAVNCALFGAFANNGQVCRGFERAYVEATVYEEFVEKLVAKVSSLRNGLDENSDLGSLAFAPQIDIVDAHIRDAVAKGARIRTGGHRIDRPGAWFEPTVLVDVDHTMRIMREETFGPVLPIVRVADAEEAISLANDSDFGLTATVFARDSAEGERVAARLEVGAVNIGDFVTNMMCTEAPQEGWKNSGIGARGSENGLLKFTRAKVIASSRIPALDNEPIWFPYTPARRTLVRTLIRFIQGRGLGRFGL